MHNEGSESMTEFEKKQSGQIYDARDPQLRKQQNRAKNLMRKYNDFASGSDSEEEPIFRRTTGILREECARKSTIVCGLRLQHFSRGEQFHKHALYAAGYRADSDRRKYIGWAGR